MFQLHRRLLVGGTAAAVATATLVAMSSGSPAIAASNLTVPSQPGRVSTSWTGNAPFNNGNSGLVWGQLGVDDPTGACDPAHPELNSQHKVKVSFPTLPKSYETLVRFTVGWKDDAGANTTNDLAR